MKKLKGFTLVELVITIAIVIILSVISVPIYRGYVDKAKMAEGYALLGTILSAQKAYYSEHGHFYWSPNNMDYDWSCCYPELGIDARGNKYFTVFYSDSNPSSNFNKIGFYAYVKKPEEVKGDEKTRLGFKYNVTLGFEYFKEDASTRL
mgnify:CR=1 FL=1